MAANRIAVGGGTRALQESEVIPESKMHADPDAQPQRDWASLTINGQPIPEDMWPTMRYQYTDQGMQEANGGRPVQSRAVEDIIADLSGTDEVVKAAYARADCERRGVPIPREVTTILARAAGAAGVGTSEDALKNIDRYQDGRIDDNLVLGQDPLQHLIDEFTPPGHHGMMIGETKAAKAGHVRGVLKFEPVLVKNEQTGRMERVTQGGMYLASVPIAMKEKEQAYYRDLNETKAKQSTENMQEAANKIGPAPSARSGFKGIEVEDASAAEMEIDLKFANANTSQ